MNIYPIQHSKIMGYSLVGYGLFSFYGVANIVWLNSKLALDSSAMAVVMPQVVWGVLVGLVSLIAGGILGDLASDIDIREHRSEAWLSSPKLPGILFVFVAIGSFPLGTILSAYVLLYLYVITPERRLVEESSSDE